MNLDTVEKKLLNQSGGASGLTFVRRRRSTHKSWLDDPDSAGYRKSLSKSFPLEWRRVQILDRVYFWIFRAVTHRVPGAIQDHAAIGS